MTFNVHFYAEQAFLAQTKSLLKQKNREEEPEVCALCILACAAAVEAISNNLLAKVIKSPHFDELKISSKIEQILLFGGIQPNWGIEPWQTIGRLIKSRNWLAHYKEHDIGLINSESEWLRDAHNRAPKIDPFEELSFQQARSYYDNARRALQMLVQCAGADRIYFEYLYTEQYEPFLVG